MVIIITSDLYCFHHFLPPIFIKTISVLVRSGSSLLFSSEPLSLFAPFVEQKIHCRWSRLFLYYFIVISTTPCLHLLWSNRCIIVGQDYFCTASLSSQLLLVCTFCGAKYALSLVKIISVLLHFLLNPSVFAPFVEQDMPYRW